MKEFKPTHILCFYDDESSKYDLECALAGKNMRLMIEELRNKMRTKIKYEDKPYFQEFRDCLNELMEEYGLQDL